MSWEVQPHTGGLDIPGWSCCILLELPSVVYGSWCLREVALLSENELIAPFKWAKFCISGEYSYVRKILNYRSSLMEIKSQWSIKIKQM